MSPPGSPIGSVRRSLLLRLQEEIYKSGWPAVVALADSDRPALYTIGPEGRWVAVVAMWLGSSWWFVWGKNGQAVADSPETAARVITGRGSADLGKVPDLVRRRFHPRGDQVAPAIPRPHARVA